MPTPIFQQIKDWMREQITSGAWPEHYKLPSEVELASQLGVNRGTVRKAIAHLLREGLLVTIHGRGTFVASRGIAQPLAERLVTFSEDLLDKGIPFETRVLYKSVIPAPPVVASMLSLPVGQQVFAITRVRSVASEPVALLQNYVRYDLCPGIEVVDFTRHRLFETLEERFKLRLAWGQRSFEARLADEQVAQALSITPGAPVMYLEQVVYLPDNSPVEFSNVWFRGDRFRLSSVLKRHRQFWSPGQEREVLSLLSLPSSSIHMSD